MRWRAWAGGSKALRCSNLQSPIANCFTLETQDHEFLAQSTAEILKAAPFFNSLALPYVLDHVAHVEPQGSKNKHEHEFRELLGVRKNEEHAWINLYSFYQLSKSSRPDYSDMVDVVGALIKARPDDVIWSSNWPHAGISMPMPNDGDLLDFLLAAAPDETIRKSILADNPAKLYGWPKASRT